MYTTDTYYPPGVMCASEPSKNFCPTSGESGSPIMIKTGTKYSAEGILSFIKGCSFINRANNPTVYTKLSCYLPWIAEQYNLTYKTALPDDPSCSFGSGSLDLDVWWRSKCFSHLNAEYAINFTQAERECIFPYYLDGQYYDGCFTQEVGGLQQPIFRCPTYNVTDKYGDTGISSYNSFFLNSLLCPVDPNDPDSEVIQSFEFDCELTQRVIPIMTCNNNCRGGKYIL